MSIDPDNQLSAWAEEVARDIAAQRARLEDPDDGKVRIVLQNDCATTGVGKRKPRQRGNRLKKAENAELNSLLERAGADPPEITDDETLHLMRNVLRMDLSYFPAVMEAVRQGRWRTAKNKVGYVRRVAERIARRLEDPFENLRVYAPRKTIDGVKPLSQDDYVDYICGPHRKFHVSDEPFVPQDNSDDYLNDRGERVSRMEKLLEGIRPEFIESFYDPETMSEPRYFPNWDKIAAAAGLDAGECDVLANKMFGVSRDCATAGATPTEAKAINAAWRRFDRKMKRKPLHDRLVEVLRPAGGQAPSDLPQAADGARTFFPPWKALEALAKRKS